MDDRTAQIGMMLTNQIPQNDPGDVAFDCTRGVGGGQGGLDGCVVTSYAVGQGAEFSLAIEADVGHPDVQGQVLIASFAHHECQAAGVLDGCGQRGTSIGQLVEALALGVGEALWASHDPVGDPADGHVGQRSGRGDRPVAVRLQVPTDGVDIAAVAEELLDLPGERGGVDAAFYPAVVQVDAVVVDECGTVSGRSPRWSAPPTT